MSSVVIERNNVSQHSHSLVEGAVTIIVTVSVLLQEIVLEKLGYIESNLVGFRKRALS
jgi:hypothetical protein